MLRQSGKPEENPSEAATVADELEQMLFFLTDVIYPVIPSIYESIEQALARCLWAGTLRALVLTRFFSLAPG